MTDRAIVFIDGNNWFHGIQQAGVENRAQLDYRKISKKLLGPREWLETRYYIGQINQQHNAALYAQQRSFLAGLTSTDARISVHLGRIEARRGTAANELRDYLANTTNIEPTVLADLKAIAARHCEVTFFVEKAVAFSRSTW